MNRIEDTARTVETQTRADVPDVFGRVAPGLDVLLGRNEPPVGTTPKDTLLSQGTMRLYRYRPMTDEVYRVPLVFVMSLVSKSYILDLVPGQSFVEYLLQHGYDVYMVDWGVPRAEDHTLRLDDYVLDMLPKTMEEVRKASGQEDVSLLGYCMGGMFSLMYAAAFPDAGVKNLVTVAAPVDYSGLGLMRHWADPRWFNVDHIVDAYGNVPADMVRMSIELLRPLERPMGYVRLFENFQDESYVYNWRIRYNWAQDQIPFPGEAYRQMTKELMWGNKLIKGEMELDGHRLDLQQVRCSTLNAIAEFDHIAPYESTKPLLAALGGDDNTELVVRGGHVSLIAGRNALMRLWPTVNEWLSVRSL